MKYIILDKRYLLDKEEAHSYLKERFDFPDYYGKNLDALYDMLTSLTNPISVIFTSFGKIENDFHGYKSSIIETFKEASQANKNLEIQVL